MVSTWLIISLRIDCVSFAKFDFTLRFKLIELPPYKWIIKGINFGCDKRPPPVCIEPKVHQIFLSFRREEHKPVVRILELRYLLFRDSNLHKYFILSRWRTDAHTLLLFFFLIFTFSIFSLLGARTLLRILRLMLTCALTSCFTILNFSLQLICSCLNWHTCAMETKRKQHVFACLSLISYLELIFRKRERMTYR